MHVEPLEKLPRSVREFLSHYSMIVLSILTALALEQAALGMEHRHEANRAKHEIELEIASNRAAVDDAIRETDVNAKAWHALLDRSIAEVKADQSTNESRVATLKQAAALFQDSLPPLKTTAWDAALSDHSVNYLGHDDLTRYSELYAVQRMFSQALWDTIRDSAQHDISNISLAASLDKADPTATLATLNSRMRTIEILRSQLAQLHDALKAAASPDGAAAPTPPSGASR